METLKFDQQIYNEGFGAIFTRCRMMLWPGFGIGLFIIALNLIWRVQIPIPGVILPLLSVYTVLSVIGLPLTFYLRGAYRRQLQKTTLTFDGQALVYERPTGKLFVSVGQSEERHLFRIDRIDRVKSGRYSYAIRGDIEERVLYGEDAEAPKRIFRLSLPKAYRGLEQLLADKIKA